MNLTKKKATAESTAYSQYSLRKIPSHVTSLCKTEASDRTIRRTNWNDCIFYIFIWGI